MGETRVCVSGRVVVKVGQNPGGVDGREST